jgi:vacuolar iron transporter family protein
MGAVGYTSSVSQRDYFQAERGREAAEIEAMPEAERQEIRQIYATKGFSGELLESVVDTITVNGDSWLSTMMDEELHLQPVESADIFRSAVVITIATLIGHLIPSLPFVWLPQSGPDTDHRPQRPGPVRSGRLLGCRLVGDWRKSGLKMVVIGLGAAAIGFLIGNLFHAAGA